MTEPEPPPFASIDIENLALLFLARLRREFESVGERLEDQPPARRAMVEQLVIEQMIESIKPNGRKIIPLLKAARFTLAEMQSRAREIEAGQPFSSPKVKN